MAGRLADIALSIWFLALLVRAAPIAGPRRRGIRQAGTRSVHPGSVRTKPAPNARLGVW